MDLGLRLFSVWQDYGLEGYAKFPGYNEKLFRSQHASAWCSPLQVRPQQGKFNLFLNFFFFFCAANNANLVMLDGWNLVLCQAIHIGVLTVLCHLWTTNPTGFSRIQEKMYWKDLVKLWYRHRFLSWICWGKITYVPNVADLFLCGIKNDFSLY